MPGAEQVDARDQPDSLCHFRNDGDRSPTVPELQRNAEGLRVISVVSEAQQPIGPMKSLTPEFASLDRSLNRPLDLRPSKLDLIRAESQSVVVRD